MVEIYALKIRNVTIVGIKSIKRKRDSEVHIIPLSEIAFPFYCKTIRFFLLRLIVNTVYSTDD